MIDFRKSVQDFKCVGPLDKVKGSRPQTGVKNLDPGHRCQGVTTPCRQLYNIARGLCVGEGKGLLVTLAS